MILAIVTLFALQCASANLVLDCTYSVATWPVIGNVYSCDARVIALDQTRNVVGVSQNHLPGMSDKDVKALKIDNQPIGFIPEDIDLHFISLEALSFYNSSIKSLTKEDLKHFPKLKLLRIWIGQLATVNGDVFMYSPELQDLDFDSNQITNVGPGIFQHTPKLSTAHLSSNLGSHNRRVYQWAIFGVNRSVITKIG